MIPAAVADIPIAWCWPPGRSRRCTTPHRHAQAGRPRNTTVSAPQRPGSGYGALRWGSGLPHLASPYCSLATTAVVTASYATVAIGYESDYQNAKGSRAYVALPASHSGIGWLSHRP